MSACESGMHEVVTVLNRKELNHETHETARKKVIHRTQSTSRYSGRVIVQKDSAIRFQDPAFVGNVFLSCVSCVSWFNSVLTDKP